MTCWVSEHNFKTSAPLLFWFEREGVFLWAVQTTTSILPFTLLSKPTKLNGFSESHSPGFTRFWSVRTWSIWFKILASWKCKKKLWGEKDKKNMKKTEDAYFCQVFLVLLWLGFCPDLFGFACPLFAMVCEPQFQTLSISAFENAIFWNNHNAVRSRFILPCKSDCQPIFLK